MFMYIFNCLLSFKHFLNMYCASFYILGMVITPDHSVSTHYTQPVFCYLSTKVWSIQHGEWNAGLMTFTFWLFTQLSYYLSYCLLFTFIIIADNSIHLKVI